MIGWYVNDHGSGHAQRLVCVSPHLRTPVTGLSSLARPASFGGPWMQLPSDRPTGTDVDVDAGGTLHWAPRHHAGLRQRMSAIAAWVERVEPALMVVDVSVEVALLARTLGVPVIVVAMRGDRSDRPHRLAYELADALLAPWPAEFAESWPDSWSEKTWHVGAFSRFDGRRVSAPPGRRRVVVLWGSGGSDVSVADVAAARAATPQWTWEVSGLPGSSWTQDAWSLLQEADVVVCHAGQNVLAEVAAARRPAIVIPQHRPFGEQAASGAALTAAGLALVRPEWPRPEDWPALLAQAAGSQPGDWTRWSDGQGAQRAARLLDGAVCAPR